MAKFLYMLSANFRTAANWWGSLAKPTQRRPADNGRPKIIFGSMELTTHERFTNFQISGAQSERAQQFSDLRGARNAKDPKRFTTIIPYVEPGGSVCQEPREVHTYKHLGGARVPNTPRTPGGSQI